MSTHLFIAAGKSCQFTNRIELEVRFHLGVGNIYVCLNDNLCSSDEHFLSPVSGLYCLFSHWLESVYLKTYAEARLASKFPVQVYRDCNQSSTVLCDNSLQKRHSSYNFVLIRKRGAVIF